MCAWAVVPTAVTGAIVAAAWGNRVRDNEAYLKGQAGSVTIDNALLATGSIASPIGFVAGPGPSAQYQFIDRVDGTGWVWYASGGRARLYSAGRGDVLSVGYAIGDLQLLDIVDNAILPGRLHQTALTGFLRGGTWTYSYNGDGTINSQNCVGGPLTGVTITYEYAGGQITAVRFRPTGGAGGGVLHSVVYTYDGSGRIATEAHS